MKSILKKTTFLKKLKSPLFRDSAFQFILSTSTAGITFIQIPLLIKSLSLSGFGYLIICQTIGAIWAALTICQFNQAVLAYAPSNDNKDSIIKRTLILTILNYIFSMLIFSALAYQLAAIIPNYVSDISKSDILVIIPLTLSAAITGSPFLGAAFRVKTIYHEYMIAQLATAIFRLCTIYYCMQSDLGIWYIACAAFLLPDLVKIIILWLRVNTKLTSYTPLEKGTDNKIIRLSLAMNLHAITDLPTQQLDKLILLPLIGLNNIGIYQSIKRIGLLTSMVTGPFSGSLFHEYSKYINEGKQQSAIQLFHKTLPPFLFITGSFSLLLWCTRLTWGPIMLPGAPIDDSVLAGILILYCIASSFVGLHPLLISLKAIKKSLAITAFSNMLFILCAMTLAPKMQTLGIIIALYIQIISLLGIKYWIAKRHMETTCF